MKADARPRWPLVAAAAVSFTALMATIPLLASAATSPLLGKPAADFALKAVAGDNVRLSEHLGEVVLLNFWASWCGPCRGETPELEALWAEHGDSLTLVGVNIQETAGNAQEFVSDFDLTYPIVLDRDGEVTLAYRAKQPPTSVLVGPDGTVLKLYFGRLSSEELDALADEYLQ